MDAFLKGKPVVYSGFDRKLYIATFSWLFDGGVGPDCGVGELEINDLTTGDCIHHRIMHREKALAFFRTLDADAA